MVSLWSKISLRLGAVGRNHLRMGSPEHLVCQQSPVSRSKFCYVLNSTKMHIHDDVNDGRDGGDDGVDQPGESVVLPLPLLRPNWARSILKDLTKYNHHCLI